MSGEDRLIEYILLSEFDINEGGIVRIQYPNPVPNSDPEAIANYMLPEGGHTRRMDTTYFILNRPQRAEDPLSGQTTERDMLLPHLKQKYNLDKHPDIGKVKDIPFAVYVYVHFKQLNEWHLFGSGSDAQTKTELSLSASAQVDNAINNKSKKLFHIKLQKNKKGGLWEFVITQDSKMLFNCEIHEYLQYTKLSDNFASVYSREGKSLGFEFKKESDMGLFDGVFLLPTPAGNTTLYNYMGNINQESGVLYFLNVMFNKIDPKVKRGSIVKAMAIGSRYRMVESFKRLISMALVDYFSMQGDVVKARELIAKLFNVINGVKPKTIPVFNYFEQQVFRQSDCSTWLKGGHKLGMYFPMKLNWNNCSIELHFPLCLHPDELLFYSFKKLLMKFQESVMIIFDALLLEKKILFVGGLSISVQEVAEYLFGCLSMVSPPLLGIMERVFPYATLTNLEILEVPGYIACVSNPMFKQRENWYDVCCDVETGKVMTSPNPKYDYKNETYYTTDLEFISIILNKMRNYRITEEEIRSSFAEYTQIILDLAMGEQDYLIDPSLNQTLANTQWHRILYLKRTRNYSKYRYLQSMKNTHKNGGVSLRCIESHLRKLKFRKEISGGELLMIYTDIYKYVSGGGEQQIIELLSYLPKYRDGLQSIAIGVFSANNHVVKKTMEILEIIKTNTAGIIAFSNLSFFVISAYNRISNKMKQTEEQKK